MKAAAAEAWAISQYHRRQMVTPAATQSNLSLNPKASMLDRMAHPTKAAPPPPAWHRTAPVLPASRQDSSSQSIATPVAKSPVRIHRGSLRPVAATPTPWVPHRIAPAPPDAASPSAVAPVPARLAPPRNGIPSDQALALRLLEELYMRSKTSTLPSRPVRSHATRLPSLQRGVSTAFLRALCRFFAKHGAVQLGLEEVCDHETLPVSICRLTRSTGLSLVETLMLLAQQTGKDVSALFGTATTFVTYAWRETTLADVGAACDRGVAKLRRDEHYRRTTRRYLWIDALCASQNLLRGRFDEYLVGRGRYTEDVRDCYQSPLRETRETILLLDPLLREWHAPPDPFLIADAASAGTDASRSRRHQGPRALTRAHCLVELATQLAAHAGMPMASILAGPATAPAAAAAPAPAAAPAMAPAAAPAAEAGGSTFLTGLQDDLNDLEEDVATPASLPAASTAHFAKAHTLLVELRGAEREQLDSLLDTEIEGLADVLASADARDAQLRDASDRDFLCGRAEALGGWDAVNALVRGALREWLIRTATERATSAAMGGRPEPLACIHWLVTELTDQGRAAEAEPHRARAVAGGIVHARPGSPAFTEEMVDL